MHDFLRDEKKVGKSCQNSQQRFLPVLGTWWMDSVLPTKSEFGAVGF